MTVVRGNNTHLRPARVVGGGALLWCLLPPRAESKAVQVWLGKEGGRKEEKDKGSGRESTREAEVEGSSWWGGATRRSPAAPF